MLTAKVLDNDIPNNYIIFRRLLTVVYMFVEIIVTKSNTY